MVELPDSLCGFLRVKHTTAYLMLLWTFQHFGKPELGGAPISLSKGKGFNYLVSKYRTKFSCKYLKMTSALMSFSYIGCLITYLILTTSFLQQAHPGHGLPLIICL